MYEKILTPIYSHLVTPPRRSQIRLSVTLGAVNKSLSLGIGEGKTEDKLNYRRERTTGCFTFISTSWLINQNWRFEILGKFLTLLYTHDCIRKVHGNYCLILINF